MKTIKLLVSLTSVAIDSFIAMAKDGGLQEDPAVEIAQYTEISLQDGLVRLCSWNRQEARDAVTVKVEEDLSSAYDIFKDMSAEELAEIQYEVNGRSFSGTEFMEIYKDGPVTLFDLKWTPVQMMPAEWWYGWAGAEYGQWYACTANGNDLFYTPKEMNERLWPNSPAEHTATIEEYTYENDGEDMEWRTIQLPDWTNS
jgi:hypothetical protein